MPALPPMARFGEYWRWAETHNIVLNAAAVSINFFILQNGLVCITAGTESNDVENVVVHAATVCIHEFEAVLSAAVDAGVIISGKSLDEIHSHVEAEKALTGHSILHLATVPLRNASSTLRMFISSGSI